MTTITTTMCVCAADYGADRFDSCAFAGQIGKTIPVVGAVSGQDTHGILRSVKVSADGSEAELTFEVAHAGESALGRKPLDLGALDVVFPRRISTYWRCGAPKSLLGNLIHDAIESMRSTTMPAALAERGRSSFLDHLAALAAQSGQVLVKERGHCCVHNYG